MRVRPSLKFVLMGYAACGLLEIAAVAAWLLAGYEVALIWTPLALPLALQAMVAIRHVRRASELLTIADGRLRYESGLAAKTTRTMELEKIQDVRVDQTLAQRLFGTGDLTLETAGETSQLRMPCVDRPRETADRILDLARNQRRAL